MENVFVEEQGLSQEEKEKILNGVLASREPLRLKVLSSKRKKLIVTLEEVAKLFEDGRKYAESEVNGILTKVWEDYAVLRRSLIDFGFLIRTPDGREYKKMSDKEL
ncbi:MAG: DUF2087 domain-containing protein [Oscillospiraceae bacterium]